MKKEGVYLIYLKCGEIICDENVSQQFRLTAPQIWGSDEVVDEIDEDTKLLYAFTKEDKIMIDFLKVRKLNRFEILYKKFTKEKYERFYKKNHDMILNGYMGTPMTAFEEYMYSDSNELFIDDMADLNISVYGVRAAIYTLKKKYFKEVKKTGLVDFVEYCAKLSEKGEPPDIFLNPLVYLKYDFEFTMI